MKHSIPKSVIVYAMGCDCDVFFDFQPYENQTATYPGCDASVDITAIEVDGKEITESFSNAELRGIADSVMEQLSELNDNSDYGDYLHDQRKDSRYE